MEFKRYMHLERFGTTEVQNIELGKTYIFPKIDGTNASVWLNDKGEIQAGSRKRHLTLEADNAGFYAWVKEQSNLLEYLKENPTHRLYGEWLVPHSLKTYKEDAWNFVKKHKNPSINFKTLQHFVFAEAKVKAPQLF